MLVLPAIVFGLTVRSASAQCGGAGHGGYPSHVRYHDHHYAYHSHVSYTYDYGHYRPYRVHGRRRHGC